MPQNSAALAPAPVLSSGFAPPIEPIFGGPDCSPRSLRDVLERKIDAVPTGGAIGWITYYFRDEALAEALIRAHRRGVSVKLCLEGRPRLASANTRVIERLSDPQFGIGAGLRVIQHVLPFHLHTKLYCFSGPRPTALIGSFNPSGNRPEDTDVVRRIGDQDRGYNLLVEFRDSALVPALFDRVAALHEPERAVDSPFGTPQPALLARDAEIYFTPFWRQNPLCERLATLERGASLRIAASHVRDFDVARSLVGLVQNGVEVELLTGATGRRAPGRIGRYLVAGGVTVHRIGHPATLPMHAKFMLAEGPSGGWSAFGSYNLTRTSRWLNQEILAFSSDPGLWRRLAARWDEMLSDHASREQAGEPASVPRIPLPTSQLRAAQ